jgi:hypothetical protein
MTRTTTAATLTACAAALTLAACGGSGTPSAADQQAKAEKAQLQYARCMRSHGVNVPDPKPGPDGGGTNIRIGGKGKSGPSPQAMNTANAACQKYIQASAPKLSPAQMAELRDQALKFAHCMRQHGVDMPDPQVGNGGIGVRITAHKSGPGAGNGLNPDSPAFKDAQEACKAFQPKPFLRK